MSTHNRTIMTTIEGGLFDGLVMHELTCVTHTRRDNQAENRLRQEVLRLIFWGADLDSFERELRAWIEKTSVGNHCKFWAFYKLERVGETVEVWHTNAHGDKDRKCFTIKDND